MKRVFCPSLYEYILFRLCYASTCFNAIKVQVWGLEILNAPPTGTVYKHFKRVCTYLTNAATAVSLPNFGSKWLMNLQSLFDWSPNVAITYLKVHSSVFARVLNGGWPKSMAA